MWLWLQEEDVLEDHDALDQGVLEGEAHQDDGAQLDEDQQEESLAEEAKPRG